MDVRVPALLDEFCRHGIFRKYERVLIVGCGLGGAARWWALRFGCSVIGVDSRPRMALAAQMLSRRARLDRQTQFLASDDGLPFRDACLTHAWIGGDFALYADRLALVHETLRVLRPGGALSGVVDGSLPAAGVDRCLRCLREAGFIAVQCRQPPAAAAPHSLLTALRRLETIAERQPGTRLAQLVASMRMDIERTMPPLQLFGERPS
jgi:SAM-dependent methyltransferase